MSRIQRYGSSRPKNLSRYCTVPVHKVDGATGAVTWGSSMYRLKIASSPCHSKSPTDGMIHAFRLNRAPCRNKAASLGSSHTQWSDRGGDLAGTARCKDSADRESIKHYACRERVGSGLHAFS
ncbi:hypothetical protein QR685DRAFT_506210 [Neurospora intermedia]|uniref:Questionable protein n=1 Tax=Neurospora intermedia TaxID=5142 RepID=A0ABR3D0N7_NEUIN